MIEQVLTMKRTAALCLVGAFCSLNAQAQKIQVKGNLVDRANALNFLPFNIYVFKPYLIDY